MDDKDIGTGHEETRGCLRVLGPVVLLIGLGFMAVGLIDFFSAFGDFGHGPTLFWCLFVGMPLLFVGIVLTSFGYMGSVARYEANEIAPVTKDTINYLASGTAQGMETAATALGRGLSKGLGMGESSSGVICPACGEDNDADARFCDKCGVALSKKCSACATQNDAGAKFCDSCGESLG